MSRRPPLHNAGSGLFPPLFWPIPRAAVDLLTPAMQDLYGFRWPWLNHAAVRLGSALLMGSAISKMPYEKLLPELRAQSATHAFGKVAKRRRREQARASGSAPS